MVFPKNQILFPSLFLKMLPIGLRIQGVNDKRILEKPLNSALRGDGAVDEMKDRLNDNALGMSGGQQQRLVMPERLR